jgi:uncharacterized protein involved in type VI secretion and phage assembly
MDRTGEMLASRTHAQVQSRYYGKYRGLVKEVGEGDDLGYIRALVPEILGDEVLSAWAAPAVPFAGKDHGWVTIPEEDDGVWIEFEAGELSRPIWSGFFWARGEIPAGAGPKTRIFATTGGHRIVLDDDANEVRIEHADGASIVLTDSDLTLKLGGKQIVISSTSVNINKGNLEVT